MFNLSHQASRVIRRSLRDWRKLLPTGAILLIALWFLGVPSSFSQASPSPGLVQQGTLVSVGTTQDGQPTVGRHAFSLISLSGGGFQLLTHARLTVTSKGSTSILFQGTASLLLNSDWTPASFAADTERPESGRTLQFAQVNGDQVSIWKLNSLDSSTETTSFTVTHEPWIFADNISSTFVVLYQLWKARGEPQSLELSFVVTNKLAHASISLEDKGMVTLIPEGGKSESQARELFVSIEGAPFTNLIGDQHGLLGLIAPGQTKAMSYLEELFPQGFSIKK